MQILVTSIGSYAADIVIKTLRANHHKVIGCDILPQSWLAESLLVDHFVTAPRYTDRQKYKSFIRQICTDYDLEYIIPLTDPELDIMGEMKDELRAAGVCPCISELATIKLCRDKHLLTEYLTPYNICPIIPSALLTETNKTTFDYPLLAKPRYGRSSQGVIKVSGPQEMEYVKFQARTIEYILLPYIEGKIISVDVVRSRGGTIVCIARRELLRNPNGAGTTVEIIENPNLNSYCMEITNKLGIIGTAVLEFIETKQQLYFMEINPRFSGGVKFSQMAGYDVISNHLKCFIGEPIDPLFRLNKMIIARKYEEYITQILDEA